MNKCENCKANKICDHNNYGFENCCNYISADVVEVVRCKDCVFCVKTQGACIWCRLNDCGFDKDGFCSYGER